MEPNYSASTCVQWFGPLICWPEFNIFDIIRKSWCISLGARVNAGGSWISHESLLELSHLTLWNDMTKRNKLFNILLFTQQSWSDHHDYVRCCFDDFDLCWFYFEWFFRWFSHSTCDIDQAFLGRWHRQLVRPRWAGNWCRDAIPNNECVDDIFLHKTCMLKKCYSRNLFLVATV